VDKLLLRYGASAVKDQHALEHVRRNSDRLFDAVLRVDPR
jgi:hypothetical protein